MCFEVPTFSGSASPEGMCKGQPTKKLETRAHPGKWGQDLGGSEFSSKLPEAIRSRYRPLP
jgi:hypothetical protein